MGTLGGGVFWEKSSQDKFSHHSLSSLPDGEEGLFVFVLFYINFSRSLYLSNLWPYDSSLSLFVQTGSWYTLHTSYCEYVSVCLCVRECRWVGRNCLRKRDFEVFLWMPIIWVTGDRFQNYLVPSVVLCKTFLMMCLDLDSETGQFWRIKGYSPCCKGIFCHFEPFLWSPIIWVWGDKFQFFLCNQ